MELVELRRHAVVDGSGPVCVRQMPTLVIGDRYQRELGPALIDAVQILQIQPPVQGGQGAASDVFKKGEVDHVSVEVQRIELVSAPTNLRQHGHVGGKV